MDQNVLTDTPSSIVTFRTRGRKHGAITRLMSPSDLGEKLKPFVFLDLFDFDAKSAGGMPLHPHSGIATVTVLAEGEFLFDDPANGRGSIRFGGVEWMRAGAGVWHGKEMWPGDEPRIKGFQLWLALPAELEHAPVDSQYFEASAVASVGPARVILGSHEGVNSPVRSPAGINYLLVALRPGERWRYPVPAGHGQLWLAAATGSVEAGGAAVSSGEMIGLTAGGQSVDLVAGDEGAVFVIGSAVPHAHELVLGYYSVHTTPDALRRGEAKIDELAQRLDDIGSSGAGRSVPVFAG